MSKQVAEQYRIQVHGHTPVHTQILSVLPALLVLPKSRKEAAANAVMLHRYADVFAQIQAMTPDRLMQIARSMSGSVEIRIDLPALRNAVCRAAGDGERCERHRRQAEWLIRYGASNHMILMLCSEVSVEDIRRMRHELGMPVSKGRRSALPMETRLSLLADWQQLQSEETDTFSCYQKLANLYPEYSLDRLYSTIVSDEAERSGR
ncbi:hypothetical protein BG910_11100 [Neisseria chenwenguii]|uniref:DUF2857 domain-containing protein n=1 Tax=Neisseria chenwenguii TaxID=1853278 RepID=A0A220S4S5_9NEIS|nr:STY4526/YPO1902 family pathogenicity island replication protein [Neisseria chenwenguii]ASK28205.1 hypothetical protein BG910_11100 [Neisseria chenwenguii]